MTERRRPQLPFLLRVAANAVAILLISTLLPSLMSAGSLSAALAAAFLLGLVNAFVKPLLVLLTLPLTLLTLGVFLLVINGALLLLVSSFVPGFDVHGLFGAMVASVLISLVSWILSLPL